MWGSWNVSRLQCTCNWDWIIGLKVKNDTYLFLCIKCYKGIKFITSSLQSWSSEVTKANSMTRIHSHQSVSSHIYKYTYSYMSLSPFLSTFLGCYKNEFISHSTHCFAIFSFNLINYGHPCKSVCIVQTFFPLGAVGYFKPWILHIWSNHILINRHSVFFSFSQRLKLEG